MHYKNSVSPVVATALLLVVAVVAVVSFQGWFQTFTSEVTTQAEQGSISGTGIVDIQGNSLYIRNQEMNNLSVKTISIAGNDCDISENLSNGLQSVDVAGCMENVSGSTEVVIVTDKGVRSKQIYVGRGNDGGGPTTGGTLSALWNVTYDGGTYGEPRDIAVDSNDDIVIVGNAHDGSTNNYYIIKYDSSGNHIWNTTYDGGDKDYAYGVTIDSSDNVIVTGSSNDGSTDNYVTVKYDSSGNHIWNTTYDGGNDDDGHGIAVDSNDDLVVFGQSNDGSTINYVTIKYDSNGNELWSRTYDSGNGDYGYSVAIDSNDNVIVTGEKYAGSFVYYTIKYDSSGNELWNRTYDSGGNEMSREVAVDSNDNILVTGSSNAGSMDYYTIKYDSNGNELWSDWYDAGMNDFADGIAVDSNDNVLVTGQSTMNNGGDYSDDYNTIKYDSDGNVVWNATFDGGDKDSANAIAVDSNNNIYVTGFSRTTSVGADRIYYTIKYG